MKGKDMVFGILGLIIIGFCIWYALQATPAIAPGTQTGVNPAVSAYTYSNASGDTILVDSPQPNTSVSHSFSLSGQARGPWYFEASFPVEVVDVNGNVLFQGPAQAQGDWMTNDLVPFSVAITVANTYTGPATLILKKDNPSGEAQNDASVSFPVIIQ